MTKAIHLTIWLITGLAIFSGCTDQPTASPVVTEGILHSVGYELGDGRVGGFTRLPYAKAIPGGNGSAGVDAYGRLTKDFLLVSYRGNEDVTSHAIPVHCLIHVKFGDAGRPDIKRDGNNSSQSH